MGLLSNALGYGMNGELGHSNSVGIVIQWGCWIALTQLRSRWRTVGAITPQPRSHTGIDVNTPRSPHPDANACRAYIDVMAPGCRAHTTVCSTSRAHIHDSGLG